MLEQSSLTSAASYVGRVCRCPPTREGPDWPRNLETLPFQNKPTLATIGEGKFVQ